MRAAARGAAEGGGGTRGSIRLPGLHGLNPYAPGPGLTGPCETSHSAWRSRVGAVDAELLIYGALCEFSGLNPESRLTLLPDRKSVV